MKNELNVWQLNAARRYYLTHPWKFIKEIYYNIRAAHNRATKGYCDLDWMNFDTWFKYVAPQMLQDMAMHGHAYPGSEPFDTPEQWHSWLHRMADQLTTCQDEDNGNEYYKEYMEVLDKNLFRENETKEEKELREKYYLRWTEIQKEHKELFKKTMLELIEHWDCLWD